MPDPFIEQLFKSTLAAEIYERVRTYVRGADWSEFVAPSTTGPYADDVSFEKWWDKARLRDELKPFVSRLDKLAADCTQVKEKLRQLDEIVRAPGGGGPREPKDVVVALTKSVLAIRNNVTMATDKKNNYGRAVAVAKLQEVCFAALMTGVVVLENRERQNISSTDENWKDKRKESLRATYADIYVRDRAAAVHELVGDPPPEFRLEGSLGSYSSKAWLPSRIDAITKAELEPPLSDKFFGDALREVAPGISGRVTGVKESIEEQKENDDALYDQERAEKQNRRAEALKWLGDRVSALNRETRLNAATSYKDVAAGFAVYSMLAIEQMRDAFGMERRGDGNFHGSASVKRLVDTGRERVRKIEERDFEREERW